jgi:hypothetical protein
VDAQKRFGFSHTAWIKAIQREKLRIGDRPFKDRRRRYDWAVVQAYYDEGHLYEECLSRFGFAADSWTDAVRRGELATARTRDSLSDLQRLRFERMAWEAADHSSRSYRR